MKCPWQTGRPLQSRTACRAGSVERQDLQTPSTAPSMALLPAQESSTGLARLARTPQSLMNKNTPCKANSQLICCQEQEAEKRVRKESRVDVHILLPFLPCVSLKSSTINSICCYLITQVELSVPAMHHMSHMSGKLADWLSNQQDCWSRVVVIPCELEGSSVS